MHSSILDGLLSSSAFALASASARASAVCSAARSAMTTGSVGSGVLSRFFFDFFGVSSEKKSKIRYDVFYDVIVNKW